MLTLIQRLALTPLPNLILRLVFSSLSDKLGRRPIFHLLWGGSILLYLAIPASIHIAVAAQGSADPSLGSLVAFYGASTLIVSFMGATAATFPAYIADLFGSRNVAAIHGQVGHINQLVLAACPSSFIITHRCEN
jgi:MFS family permease